MCERFGWAISSSVPQKYIAKSGINQKKIMKRIEQENISDIRQELDQVKLDNQILKKTLGDFQNFKADFKEKTEEIRRIIFEQHRNKIAEMQL